MPYRVTFWGARGSIPTPGPDTARYGGNTACVALHRDDDDDNHIVVLDAGTGARRLGQALGVKAGKDNLTIDLLISHTHWDHIHGFPFFSPLFREGNLIRICGSKQGDVSLETILRYQMNPVVFPVPLDEVSGGIDVTHVTAEDFGIEGFDVRAMQMRHPGDTLGFVLTPTGGGASFAYIPDNELSGGQYAVSPTWRSEFLSFLQGVDTLVHDAMYTEVELEHHGGWGHSSHLESVELALEAGVKRLVLFHHRPEHDDGTIDAILDEAREAASRKGGALEVLAAQEGMSLSL